MGDEVVTASEEIANTAVGKPHVVLLGAGASKAAFPKGDRNGRPLPLLRDLAKSLGVMESFPRELRALAETDFEGAYSQLFDLGGPELKIIEGKISGYFNELELPDGVTLYDLLLLSLRKKDAVFTFNWDPFLLQSTYRLSRLGVRNLPSLYFLHGNVAVGYCPRDKVSGRLGFRCSHCGGRFISSSILFPVKKKNYQDKGLIQREWKAARYFLKHCFMFTVFGYSAPKTDVEAISLLKKGWGAVQKRQFEQTEIIGRPGCDKEALRTTWDKFIHTHHYEIHESFFDSWLAKHPRRTGEAWFSQFLEAKFIEDNPIPRRKRSLASLIKWFKPLLAVEGSE